MGDGAQKKSNALRWFQIRLRTLVLAFTMVAVVLAAFGFFVRPYWLQRDVIQAIKNAGGVVETRPGPSWLRAILGEENCQEITLVNLADIDPSRELLFGIKQVPDLEVLVLGGTALEDDDLRFVPKCESLEGVILDSTLISDEAIANLRSSRPEVYIARCDRRAIAYWQLESDRGPLFGALLKKVSQSAAPQEIVKRLPSQYFEQVVTIESFRADPFGIGLLATMQELREIILDLDQGRLPEDELTAITQCRRLEKLELNGGHFGVRIASFATLSRLVNLMELSLQNMNFADDDVRALESLSQLRSLDLSYTNVQDPSRWPDFPLESLALEDTFIENDDLPAIARYGDLEELSIGLTEVTDEGLPNLLPLQKLRAIRLVGTRVTEPSYDVLCQFPNLKQVALGSVPQRQTRPFGSQEMRWITPFGPEHTESYIPQDVPVFDFDPAAFKPSPEKRSAVRANVERKLGGTAYKMDTPLESLHLDLFQNVASIKELDLSDSFACDNDLRFIASMPDLEILHLNDTWVSDDGLAYLAECVKLRVLDLSGTAVTDAGIRELAKLPSLEELVIPRQTIRGESFRMLRQLPKLRGIGLGSSLRSGRERVAPDLGVEDILQLTELLRLHFSKYDADGDMSISFAEYSAGDELELVGYSVYEDSPLAFSDLIWTLPESLLLTPEAEAWVENNYGPPPW